ncbi:hypothetical protein HNY73_020519 [Argiope bruennichi]|uniref:Uncharacterized protein n=1 Tax=Argiope bruennichi TaxID=94029 RepID=A0A8T0E7X0_ARGBR|nr:hypothetical protein HNY73_020519 [Argiope bruennichi]
MIGGWIFAPPIPSESFINRKMASSLIPLWVYHLGGFAQQESDIFFFYKLSYEQQERVSMPLTHFHLKDFAIAENFTKEAAILAGHPFHSTGLVPLRNEYCAWTDDQKSAIFHHITGLLIDAFTAICSSLKTRHQCDHFEKYLDCGFSLMEKYAAIGICSVLDR